MHRTGLSCGRRRVVAFVACLSAAAAAAGVLGPAGASGAPGAPSPLPIKEFPTGNTGPLKITTGPDGNLWFTENRPPGIGRITPTGSTTHFPVEIPPDTFSVLNDITAGPDGALWFTDEFVDRVGRITTTGQVTFFTIPPHDVDPIIAPSGVQSGGITTGPDGNLWFTEQAANQVVRLTPSGQFTEFPLPIDPIADPENGPDVAFPADITTGPDGNLWFTEARFGGGPGIGNKIGRITTSGAITEFPIPTVDSFPVGITTGPDGNIWFTEEGSDALDDTASPVDNVARITPSGVITEFPVRPGSNPADIVTGADGNLWVTENRASAIARVTSSGDVTEFPTPTPDSRPLEITAGPDGRVWFVEVRPSQIARTQVLGCTAHRTGLVSGPLNLTSGATCITGAQVSGPITVGPGASLFVDNSRVTGDVTSDGAGVLRLCGTQVQSGSVVARRTVDAVVIGDPSQGCGGDDVSGSVTLTDNAAPTDVVGATTIGGDLGCTGNTPPPADGGQPAAVGGTRSGQCATASTTSTTASTTTTTTTAATSTTTTVVANPSVCTVLAQQLQATADPATRAALESVRRTLSCP